MNAGRAAYDEQCAEDGYDIVELSVSGNSCDECAKWEGQIFSLTGATPGIPTKQDLIDAGVFHPNCTHRYSVVTDYELKKRGYKVRQPDPDELGKQQEENDAKTPVNINLDNNKGYAAGTSENPGNPKTVFSSENSMETIKLVNEPPPAASDSIPEDENENIRKMLGAKEIDRDVSIIERLQMANDGTGTIEEKQNNCQRCTVAFEMLCRGINVNAKPSVIFETGIGVVSSAYDEIATNWPKRYIGYEKQQVSINGNSADAQITEISHMMEQYGNGARAELYVRWKDDERGHVLTVMQVDGKTIFLDPQTARLDKEDYLRVCDLSQTKLTRVDNLQINLSLIHHVCEAVK